MANKDLNPKDVKDLTKSLKDAISSMSGLAEYAKEFNKNICGAKACLDEIAGKKKKIKNTEQDTTKETQEQAKNQKEINDALQETLDKEKELAKKKKANHDIMKASLQVIGDMAGAAGFGGVMNTVADIAGAFMKGGPLLGGLSILTSGITFIFNKFLEIDEQVDNISQNLGRGGSFARGLAANSFTISKNFASYGIDIKEAAEAAVSLGKEFTNLSYVTKENQTTIALMGKQLGIGAAASAKALGTFMNMTGSSFSTAKNMAAVAMSVAKTSNLPLGAIMEDLASNSESAAKYGGKFSQSTIIASAAAKKMGMSFSDVAKIAEGILDIESSVEKQFEAQVLLGREVNLEQARYYSLIGDTSKMQKEVLKQVGSQAQFEKMMPMQRQALADAIGIGVEQLGKMVSRGKEALSVEEKTYNLQKQSLDQQLAGSDRMIGVVKQIEGALTELGYAIIESLFGVDVAGMFEKGADAGANFANMISEAAKSLRDGHGPLFNFIDTIKSGIEFIKEWGTTILWITGILYAIKTAISVTTGIMAIHKVVTAATAVTQTAATAPTVGFFGALAIGLGTLIPLIPVLGLVSLGLAGIGAIFLGLGMTITGIARLGETIYGLTQVDLTRLDNVFSAISDNAKRLNKDKEFTDAADRLKSLGTAFYNISKYGSGGTITIKTQMESAENQKNYNSESLKYLKIIALSTTIMAEKQGANIRGGRVDADLTALLT